MAYPKKSKQELGDYDTKAAAAPSPERVVAPQVGGVRGGAPKLNTAPTPATLSQRPHFAGMAERTPSRTRSPVPPVMSLPEAQKSLKDLAARVKEVFDARLESLPESERGSRFWRMYQDYGEHAATLIARRIHTDQIARTGSVADWMGWLDNGKRR